MTILAQHVKRESTIKLHSKLNKTALSRSVCIFFIWIYLDQKKSQAPEIIMSFIRMVENQNDNRSIIVKRHDKTPYEIFRERIPDISYFYVFRCLVFIHNHNAHLGKFDAKADDRYFLGYSFVTKAFRVFNTRRQQIKETYHISPDELFYEDDPSRQYQVDADISYYVIPHGRSLSELTLSKLTQDNQVLEVIALNKPDIPHTEDTKVPDVTQTHILNQASISSHHVPQDRWLRDQHIKLVNIMGDPSKGILTRSMAAKLTAVSASECLFANFLSKIEPKNMSKALKHLGWVDAMQEEPKQFYRNKVWTLVPLSYGKTAIGSKWLFMNKKDDHGINIKNKARLVAQGYSQEEGIDYDETFAPLDDKGILISQEQYTRNLLKKYEISDSFSVQTHMVPSNNLGPDLVGKPVNETSYRGMIRSLMYLIATRPDIHFSIVLCAKYQFNPKESDQIAVKRSIKYLKGTLTLGLYYPKCSGFDLKGYSESDYTNCNMERKSTLDEAEYVAVVGCCASILWIKS
nr:hypothetical protein [Tanacetum cinerariifolium]